MTSKQRMMVRSWSCASRRRQPFMVAAGKVVRVPRWKLYSLLWWLLCDERWRVVDWKEGVDKSGQSLFSRDETTFLFQALFIHRAIGYVFRDIEMFGGFTTKKTWPATVAVKTRLIRPFSDEFQSWSAVVISGFYLDEIWTIWSQFHFLKTLRSHALPEEVFMTTP